MIRDCKTGYWCPVPHLNSISLIIVYPAPIGSFKQLPDHRSGFISFTLYRKTQGVNNLCSKLFCRQILLNYITPCVEEYQYMYFLCMVQEQIKEGWNFSHSSVELCFSHSAEFESHLPNTVKTSIMDFNFVVAHDTDLLKLQIYLYEHPTFIETILCCCFEKILCVPLAMQ